MFTFVVGRGVELNLLLRSKGFSVLLFSLSADYFFYRPLLWEEVGQVSRVVVRGTKIVRKIIVKLNSF